MTRSFADDVGFQVGILAEDRITFFGLTRLLRRLSKIAALTKAASKGLNGQKLALAGDW